MCGNPFSTKFHYPLCPVCREHRILSQKHIRCRFCRARRNGRKAAQVKAR
jgi:hypothetical protein